MSVLGRAELEKSPLSDLHLIATELGLDGFRRLRKADLIDAIIERQGGEPEGDAGKDTDQDTDETEAVSVDDEPDAATTAKDSDDSDSDDDDDEDEDSDEETSGDEDTSADPDDADEEERPRARRGRGGRGRGGRGRRGRSQNGGDDDRESSEEAPEEEKTAEGVVELLSGGSGFVRLAPPEPSDEDVYISAAQVRRCELVDGDTVAGPVRPPRRSERYPSLVRVDTINGAPADQVSAGTRYDDLPATYPDNRFALSGEDPTVKAIEWLTPFGRGSRVTITGPARAGKTEAISRLAAALEGVENTQVSLVLTGVRPEEIAAWRGGSLDPAAALTFAAGAEAQDQAVEHAVEQARRVASRGGDAVVLVDTLDGLHPIAARRALAAARNLVDSGSLTVIATSTTPLGGESTVIALDPAMTSTGRFPALDLVNSGTIRPDLLVGQAGADAIARARAEAVAATS
jgi:transcription termination factor Rho